MSAGEQRAATSFGDPNARPPTPQQTPTVVLSSPLPQTPKQTHFDEPQASGWTPRFAEEYSVFNSTPGNLRGNSSSIVSGVTATPSFNLDFAPLSPVPPSTGKKRPLSAELSAVDAGSATCAPVDPARRLLASPEPLIPAHKDVSSPDLDDTPRVQKQSRTKTQSPSLHQQQQLLQQGQRSTKKSRKESCSAANPRSSSKENIAPPRTQTATPPPSSRGGRKLAPRVQMENMQSQSFERAADGYPGAAQPHLNTSYVTGNPDDVFGYAMGGPATAPPMTESRPFWGMDLNANAMSIDVDLSAAGADIFQTTTPAQNWGGRTNQMFQQTEMVTQQSQHDQQQPSSHSQSQGRERRQSSAGRDRPLAPKTAAMSTSNFEQTTPNQTFSFESFQMSMDDPFGASPGGVDPGMLFTQPVTTTGMDPGVVQMSMLPTAAPPRPTSSAPATMGQTTVSMAPGSMFATTSSGAGYGNQRRLSERPSNVVSPTKNGGSRPNLSRSFSESARGGKRIVGGSKNPLPALAPAKPATVHLASLPASQTAANGVRSSNGRTSPLKPSHHHRLSSLTSIPENAANFPSRSSQLNSSSAAAAAAKRTSVKFVIDENGRARAETVRDDSADEGDYNDAPELLFPSFSASHNSWGGSVLLPSASYHHHHHHQAAASDEEYSSSDDDEPIIIPSRNTSFSYPEPPRSSSAGGGAGPSFSRPPTSSSILSNGRTRQRSSSDRSTSSSFRRAPLPLHHPDDEAATSASHNNMMGIEHPRPPRSQGSSGGRPSTGGGLGDAAAELRKVMQGLNPRRTSSNPNPQLILGSGGGGTSASRQQQQLTPGQRSSSSTISEASLAPPPSGGAASPTRLDQLRCICNRPEAEVDGVQFLVKCDSCEYLLHGRCVDVFTPQDVPHVYICAFCANTPNMRGGRMRYTGRNNTTNGGGGGANVLMGPPVTLTSAAAAAIATSPLARKSYRSFR